MSTLAQLLGLALIAVLVSIVVGCAACAAMDRQYMGIDDEVHPL